MSHKPVYASHAQLVFLLTLLELTVFAGMLRNTLMPNPSLVLTSHHSLALTLISLTSLVSQAILRMEIHVSATVLTKPNLIIMGNVSALLDHTLIATANHV